MWQLILMSWVRRFQGIFWRVMVESRFMMYRMGSIFLLLLWISLVRMGYILDEPEAALSPIRQMSLISRMDDELVKGGSQFIIATHSPILMAYPKSFIYETKENIERVSYEESDNYNITKDFLNNYKKMIHMLTK